MRRVALISIVIWIVLLTGCSRWNPWSGPSAADQEDLLLESIFDMDELMDSEVAPPVKILHYSRAIVIFPRLVKAGLIGGAQVGDGVVSLRHPKTKKWGRPGFVSLKAASIGIQAGVQRIDLVLVGMTKPAVVSLLKSKATLGRDFAITAGPLGRRVEKRPLPADFFKRVKPMYSYSVAKGAFAGTSLQGAVITPDEAANRAFYGRRMDLKDILTGRGEARLSEAAKSFMKNLDRMAPPPKIRKK